MFVDAFFHRGKGLVLPRRASSKPSPLNWVSPVRFEGSQEIDLPFERDLSI